jgi:hypothetical protein
MMLTANVLHPSGRLNAYARRYGGPFAFSAILYPLCLRVRLPKPLQPAGLRRERQGAYRVPLIIPDRLAPVSYPGGVFRLVIFVSPRIVSILFFVLSNVMFFNSFRFFFPWNAYQQYPGKKTKPFDPKI